LASLRLRQARVPKRWNEPTIWQKDLLAPHQVEGGRVYYGPHRSIELLNNNVRCLIAGRRQRGDGQRNGLYGVGPNAVTGRQVPRDSRHVRGARLRFLNTDETERLTSLGLSHERKPAQDRFSSARSANVSSVALELVLAPAVHRCKSGAEVTEVFIDIIRCDLDECHSTPDNCFAIAQPHMRSVVVALGHESSCRCDNDHRPDRETSVDGKKTKRRGEAKPEECPVDVEASHGTAVGHVVG